MSDATTYALSDGVATVTLNRPERRNSLTASLLNSLGDHLAKAATDEDCRVVVIANAGPAFCAGADLKGGDDEQPRWSLAGVLSAILEHDKPVVARITGHCMGGGVGLAAACDISIATRSSLFGFTEVRIGVAPAIISVVCLEKMRTADALELFLSGRRIDAARAVDVGLVTRAVEPEQIDEELGSVLADLRLGSPSALSAAKALVRQVPRMSREEAFSYTAKLSAELFASSDAAEGMAAFRQSRPPRWAVTDGEETR